MEQQVRVKAVLTISLKVLSQTEMLNAWLFSEYHFGESVREEIANICNVPVAAVEFEVRTAVLFGPHAVVLEIDASDLESSFPLNLWDTPIRSLIWMGLLGSTIDPSEIRIEAKELVIPKDKVAPDENSSL